jgi:hypothetical protein
MRAAIRATSALAVKIFAGSLGTNSREIRPDWDRSTPAAIDLIADRATLGRLAPGG